MAAGNPLSPQDRAALCSCLSHLRVPLASSSHHLYRWPALMHMDLSATHLVPPANLTGCTFSPFQVTDRDITQDQPQGIPCGIPQGTSFQEGMVQWLSHLSPTTQSIFTTLVGHAPPHPNNQLGYRDIVGRCWKPC